MKPLEWIFDCRKSVNSKGVAISETQDADFTRPAVWVELETLRSQSIDLVVSTKHGLFHVARINLFDSTTKDDFVVAMDICPAGGKDMMYDLLRWDNGVQVTNVRGSTISPIAFVFKRLENFFSKLVPF